MTETAQRPGCQLGGPFLALEEEVAYVRRTAARRFQIARPESSVEGLWAVTLTEIDLDVTPEREQREAVEGHPSSVVTLEEVRAEGSSKAEADLEVAMYVERAETAPKALVTKPSSYAGCERALRLALAQWDATALGCNSAYRRAALEIEAVSYGEAEADGVLRSLEALHPDETAAGVPIFRLPVAGPLYTALARNLDKRGRKLLEVEGYHSKDGHMYFMCAGMVYPPVNRALCLDDPRGSELLRVCEEAERLAAS